MTMEKRKKQHGATDDLLRLLDAVGPVSDEDYFALGSLLAKGRVHHDGRDLVLVDPATSSPKVRLSFRRTPLGMLAPTVLGALGIEDLLHDCVLTHVRPRCPHCGALTEKAQKIEAGLWPRDGYVALVVDGVTEEISLEEQCELLGAERAVVDGTLARVDGIGGRLGEPVIHLAAVSRVEEVSREIDSWFARGGGALRVVHFASRESGGVDIQLVFQDWRCVPCGERIPIPTRRALEEASPCSRCRGEGWLVVEDGRFLACEECEGYGCVTPMSFHELSGVCLKDLAACSTREVLEALPERAQHPFAALMTTPIVDYPVGAPVDLLSKGERALCSISSAAISQVSRLSLVVDVGSIGIGEEEFKARIPRTSDISLKLLSPALAKVERLGTSRSDGGVFALRELRVGPLDLESLSFAQGEASVIQGDVGTGKTLLLDEIARRFAKRKKLPHLAAFGDLKRCHIIRSECSARGSLGDILGMSEEIASEMARLRSAQEMGLVEDDFIAARSKHLCGECSGVPSLSSELCESCQGALFDAHVGSVKVGDKTFAEIMRMPLAELGRTLWSHDSRSDLVQRLPERISSWPLSTATRELPPGARRFIEIFAPLAKSLAAKGNRSPDLFLIDTPVGTGSAYQGLILASMRELVGRGATIVCAGVPKGLENLFGSVIRLRPVAQGAKGTTRSRYFDHRLARRSEIGV